MSGDKSFIICHHENTGVMTLIPSSCIFPSGICCKIFTWDLLLNPGFSGQNASCLNYTGCWSCIHLKVIDWMKDCMHFMHFHDIPRYPNSFWTDSAWVYKCHYALSGSYEVMSISVAIFSNGSQMMFISGSSRFYPSSVTLYEFRTCTMKPWVRDRCCRFYFFCSQDHKFEKLNLKTASLQTSILKTGRLKMCSSKTASFKTGSFNTCSLKTALH
jgi:hypothetical protein